MTMTRALLILSISLFTFQSIAQPLITRDGNAGLQKNRNKGMTAACAEAVSSTEMSLNNVRALIHTGGDMWWDFQTAQYEVPKGSGKTALWTGSIWIGGTDVNGQLKLAALRYRGGGVDYWTGPLIMRGNARGTTDIEVC